MTRKDPTRRDLALFGVALSAMAGVLCWRLRSPLPLALPVLYAALPRRFYLAWQRVFAPVFWLLSRAALAVVFFGVITPIGLAMRLFGWDAMGRRRAESYWHPRKDPPVERYFRTW